MKKALSLFLSIVMLASITAGIDLSALAETDTTTINLTVQYCQTVARGMTGLINEFRTGSDAWYWDADDTSKITCNNLSNLVYDYDLEQIAMQRAAEIAVYYSHNRPDGTSCFTAYDTCLAAGENIACGYTTADAVFEAWQESDDSYSGQGHRRNMLSSNYTAVGIACVYYNGRYYWVQEFRSPTVNTVETDALDGSAVVKIDALITSTTVTAPTCTADGYTTHTLAWGTTFKMDFTDALGHSYGSAKYTTKATTGQKGVITYTCSTCGATKTKNYAKIKSVTLSKTSYTYNGKAKTPTVTVKDADGNTISSKYYTVTYINQSTGKTVSSMKSAGKYYVKIKFKTKYSGTVKKAVTIKPKATSIKSVTAASKGFTVKWSKVTSSTTGYQVQYSTSKSFSSKTTKTITGNKTTSQKITGLKAKKKYYVRVRTYKTVKISGKATKIYSGWSSTKTVTTKK